MDILRADDLFRFFHPGDAEVRALRGASLGVARGETVALQGPSGSGKSTLLACIAGLDEPDGGTVTLDGRQMTRRPEAERSALRAAKIGYLAQSGNLFAHLSVAGNIALQMDLGGIGRNGAKIRDLLARVGMADRADALPETLSGGEAARAGLAVALAANPPLLLADEPTAEVDRDTETRILDVLEQRRLQGGAALIATHSQFLAARATRVLAIADGRIVEGAPQAGQMPAPARAQQPRRVTPRPCHAATLIEAHGASRAFTLAGQRVAAVDAVDCLIYAGHRIAVTGPSGSGKSTLLNLLAGLEDASGGTLAWPGLDAGRPLRPQQIGFVFQSPSLVPALSVLENVRLPLDISGLAAPLAMDPFEALDRLSLCGLREKLPDQLSGGQMQRVALARAMVTRPKIIFADEPTGQLDHATGQSVMQALLAALAGTGTALVVATHDADIAALMDETWQMANGRLRPAQTMRAVA